MTDRGARALLRDPRVRLLLTGQTASMLGDRIGQLAIPFAVLAIGGSATDVGLVAGAQFVPFAIFSLLGGVWADRVGRLATMLGSDLARVVVQASVAALLISKSATVGALAVAAFAYGTADAFFAPAMAGLLPDLGGRDNLQEVNALFGLAMAASNLAGPAIAGVVIAASGPGEAVALNAATCAISAASLVRLRGSDILLTAPDAEGSLMESLRAGFAEVRVRRWIPAFLGGMAVYTVIVLPAVFVLGPVLAQREYDGASSWAIVSVAFGVGSIIGKLLLLRFRVAHPLRWAAAALLLASCQAAIFGSGLPILAIAALEVPAGVGVSWFFVLWEITLQSEIPAHAISRVSSYDYLVSVGTMPLGLAAAGPVADAVGLHTTLRAMTVCGVLAGLALLCVPEVRRLERRRPGAVPGTA